MIPAAVPAPACDACNSSIDSSWFVVTGGERLFKRGYSNLKFQRGVSFLSKNKTIKEEKTRKCLVFSVPVATPQRSQGNINHIHNGQVEHTQDICIFFFLSFTIHLAFIRTVRLLLTDKVPQSTNLQQHKAS